MSLSPRSGRYATLSRNGSVTIQRDLSPRVWPKSVRAVSRALVTQRLPKAPGVRMVCRGEPAGSEGQRGGASRCPAAPPLHTMPVDRFYTGLGPRLCSDPAGRNLATPEEYYVRHVPPESPLSGGEYRNSGGFIGFRWMASPNCAVDSCPYWYIDSIEGAATATPGSSPTAGPTRTPITIENEAWHTRCRKFGLNFKTSTPGPTPEGTVDPWSTPFCAQATQTPIPHSGSDHQCGEFFPQPYAATAMPAPTRTQAPVPTTVPTNHVRVGVAFPTDSAPTCVPSPTPSPTPTFTLAPTFTPTSPPSLTPTSILTPTPTYTPTVTPTPLPSCDELVADRACPSSGQNCLNGCSWSVPPESFAALSCDESPEYELEVTATECDSLSNIVSRQMQWRDASGTWYAWEAMSAVPSTSPKQWTVSTCVGIEKPVGFRLKWFTTSGGSTTRGVDFATFTLCCTNCD